MFSNLNSPEKQAGANPVSEAKPDDSDSQGAVLAETEIVDVRNVSHRKQLLDKYVRAMRISSHDRIFF